jgi:hypothetical protein
MPALCPKHSTINCLANVRLMTGLGITGLTQIHGVLQSNADSLKDVLVLVGQAVIEFELAVELLLSGVGARSEVGKVLAPVRTPALVNRACPTLLLIDLLVFLC